jgi:hypothetical protein
MSLFTASYPILAKVQKPGGVTVVSTVSAGDVPNKHTYSAGTIQMVTAEATAEVEVEGTRAEAHAEATVAVQTDE